MKTKSLFDAEGALEAPPAGLLDVILHSPYVAVDVETETTAPKGITLKDYGLSYLAPVRMICVAARGQGKDNPVISAVFFKDHLPAAGDFLKQVYGRCEVIAHNAVFDMRILGKYTDRGYPEQVWDTLTMARMFKPGLSSYALIPVAKAFGLEVAADHAAYKSKRSTLDSLSEAETARYIQLDTELTLRLYEAQREHQRVQNEYDPALLLELSDWECRAVREYARMASEGIALNVQVYAQKHAALQVALGEAKEALKAKGLNDPDSPNKRVGWIYEMLGIPKPGIKDRDGLFYTVKGGLSTSTEVIDALIEMHPEHREALTWLALAMKARRALTTVDDLREHARHDQRIHSMVSIQTVTGRRASSQPNLQNLEMTHDPHHPVESQIGDMCGLLTGSDTSTLVEIDYSNAENWIAAMLSGDNALAAACSAEDFHSAMSAQYFPDAWRAAEGDKDERKRLRRMGKSVTFGTAYGMGAKKLAATLSISDGEAISILNAKDAAFHQVAHTKKLAVQKGEREGHVSLWTGRMIPVDPEQSFTAWNYLCQGGVGEMLKRSIVLISEAFRERGMKSRVAHDMHDAIILEVVHGEWDAALALASQIMEHVIPEEYNLRTEPPIRWIAEPDPVENAKKWGKGQHHPKANPVIARAALASSESEALAILVDAEETEKEAEKSEQEKAQNEMLTITEVQPGTRRITIEYDDMGEQVWEGTLVQKQQEDTQWRCTPESIEQYFTSLQAACVEFRDKPRTTYLPAKQGDQIVLSQAIQVNLENWAKVAVAWLGVADRCDVESLTGMDKITLEWEVSRRAELVGKITERLNNCEKWLGMVG